MKIQKQIIFFLGGEGSGQSGFERRIEVFVKIRGGGLVWGVRVDVNEEFCENSKKWGGGGVGLQGEGEESGFF